MKKYRNDSIEMVELKLKTADEGFMLMNTETRNSVEVTNMCGGRYLMRNFNNEIAGQTDDEKVCYDFLVK